MMTYWKRATPGGDAGTGFTAAVVATLSVTWMAAAAPPIVRLIAS